MVGHRSWEEERCETSRLTGAGTCMQGGRASSREKGILRGTWPAVDAEWMRKLAEPASQRMVELERAGDARSTAAGS